jgi:restriction endonuclease S subunit
MIYIKVYRVRASVYPTPHNKIWLSSGCVPLYNNPNNSNFISFSIKKNLSGDKCHDTTQF